MTHFLLSGGKVVRLSHKNATEAKESSKNGKFKHKGQFKKQNTMEPITEFENYVKNVYNLSELDRTISEDGRIVSYALTCRSNEHQFVNLKQVDDDYIRFEMYFENIRIQSDYFVDDKEPETQMQTLKALFDYTFDAFENSVRFIY